MTVALFESCVYNFFPVFGCRSDEIQPDQTASNVKHIFYSNVSGTIVKQVPKFVKNKTIIRRTHFYHYTNFLWFRNVLKFSRRQMTKKNQSNSPSSVLFLAINAKSISGFGSFASDDDDDEEFCICSCWLDCWARDMSRLFARTDVEDGAIWWWLWKGCIIEDNVECKWDACDDIPLNDDETQTDIKILWFA